jgi:hypothetical protein
MKESKSRRLFWLGFDIAMSGQLVDMDTEWLADGWAWGAREYCGFNYATPWEARRQRFRYALLKIRWQLKKMIRRVIRQMKLQCGILIDELF